MPERRGPQPGSPQPGGADPAVTVVIATRNRVSELCRTLDQLAALPERPPVIVVDNASADGTARAVHDRYPDVDLVQLSRNRGAWARTAGAARARSRYVAFSDDDSWWEPGSLQRAGAVLDAFPRVGLLAASTLVGPAAAPDPLNAELAASPLPGPALPGPRILGFLACACVVRRSAFLAVGGFSALLLIGGEEELLAVDLAAAGWAACYVADVVARHFPSAVRDTAGRNQLLARNKVLVAWLRRPAGVALASTGALVRAARRDAAAGRALAALLPALPRVLAGRRVLPAPVEAQLRMLERGRAS